MIFLDTEISIYQTLITNFDTHLIKLTDDVQIYFSNPDILKFDQTQLSELTISEKNFAAEITGGCLGAILILAGLGYFILRKYKTQILNFKPNEAV